MPIEILMPALSPTMEEGKLAKWLVKEGDAVTSGDVLAEIETDKATMEVEAIDEGVVAKLLVAEGTAGVPVNQLIAILLEEGEDPSAVDAVTSGGRPPAVISPSAADHASSSASSSAQNPAMGSPSHASGGIGQAQTAADSRVFASPLARRLAALGHVDLTAVQGSGPRGRIVKSDVETALSGSGNGASRPTTGSALAMATQGSAAGASATMAPTSGMAPMADDKILALYEPGSYEIEPHDGMRRIIAERLTLSKQTIPHFYLNVDCRLDALLAARRRLNDGAPREGARAFKLSVNDFIIKALALAMQQVPAANSTWTSEGTLRHSRVDVGVAVAVDGGLFTPVIRHADLKTLSEISNEMKDLASRARNKRLAPHEYQGGTTSISNLGMYGIKSFDAVINPPHASILAVGAGQEQAVSVNGKLEAATIMAVTLSCDHRVVDGAIGAELLGAFKGFIEDPVRMLV